MSDFNSFDHTTSNATTSNPITAPPIQLIDQDKNLDQDALSSCLGLSGKRSDQLADWIDVLQPSSSLDHGSEIGSDYHIVSVLGSQSSGKSTLLNSLFGTSFDVMLNGTRKQTTKGK